MALKDWDTQVASADLGASTGTPNLTKSGWGATSPEIKAAILITGGGTTLDTAVADANLSIGVTDGSTDGFISMVSSSGTTSSDTKQFCRGGTGRFACLMDPDAEDGSILGSVTHNDWILNGMELSVDDAYGADRPHMAMMFAGDLDVDVRRVTSEDDIDIGFEPDLCICLSLMNQALDDTAHQNNAITIGAFCQNDGATEQVSINYSATHDGFSFELNSMLSSTYCAKNVSGDSDDDEWTATILSDGYKIVTTTGTTDFIVLALKGTNRRIDARCRTIAAGPSNMSNVVVRGGAVSPIARILGGILASADESLRTNRFAGAIGMGFHTADDAYYGGIRESDAVSTTASESLSADQALWQRGYAAFGNPGTTLNFQATKSSTPFDWDRESLDWATFNTSAMGRIMDVTIGKGPATIVRGGKLYGGKLY